MADATLSGEIKPEGGEALPSHGTLFQIVIDTSDVTLVFIQRTLQYSGAMTPTVGHRVIAQVSMSHMLAKDLVKNMGRALTDFEKQYPIPEIKPAATPAAPAAPNAAR